MLKHLPLFLLLFCAALPAEESAQLEDGWTIRSSPTRSLLWAVDFADDQHGWAVGIQAIIRTVNGGETWDGRFPKLDKDKRYWFNSVSALSDDLVLCAGYPYAAKDHNAPGLMLRSEDGGANWQQISCGQARNRFSSLAFTSNGSSGCVLTNHDGLMRSRDRGLNWQRVSLPAQVKGNLTAQTLICLPDDQTVAVAAEGGVVISNDGGTTWRLSRFPEAIDNPHRWTYAWMCWASPQQGWAALYGGSTLETRDGGASWSVVSTGGRLWAENEQTIWRIDGEDTSRSVDGGATWTRSWRVGGGWDRPQAMAFTGQRVHVVGGAEGHGHPFLVDRPLDDDAIDSNVLPEGVVPIDLVMPEDGIVSVQILDEQGQVVKHLLNGVALPKGPVALRWDLTTLEDFWPPFTAIRDHLWQPPADAQPLAMPGTYSWRAIYHRPLSLSFKHAYYPLKEHGLAWKTPDRTGGWLADHGAPNCLVADGEQMWAGAFAEGGDGLIVCDLDMRKQWGGSRMSLVSPSALAKDGTAIYFAEAGGWTGAVSLVRLDSASKDSRLLFRGPRAKDDPTDIRGLAVHEGRAYIGYGDGDAIIVCDLAANLAGSDQQQRIVTRIPAAKAGNIRVTADGRLIVVANQAVNELDPASGRLTPIISGLTNPCGLAIDKAGNYYVGEMEPLHLVKVFSPKGRLLRSFGKHGGHPVGPFDQQRLESPRSVEIDARGHCWVTECNVELKRVSVWNREGVCIKQVLGPTVYGGGGTIDPADDNHFFYRGKEFRRDPSSGIVELQNIIWRYDDPSVDGFVNKQNHNFGGPAPSYPFHKNGKLWFRNWGANGLGHIAVLFVYDNDAHRVRPVAAVGRMPAFLAKRLGIEGDKPAFAWTDRNDDGRAQASEVSTGTVSGSATWGVRMNEQFEVAFSTVNNEIGFCFFRPQSYTKQGYPIYALPEQMHYVPNLRTWDPNQVQGMMTDRKGNAIAISPYIVSMAPDGTVNWRYKCRWPSLHAGLATTAIGIEPGVLIAPLRFYGSAPIMDDSEELFVIGSNYGSTHLMTGDGFYIDRVFADSRRGDHWRFAGEPGPEELAQVSLGQEHFGGSFQRARGADGQQHYYYVVAGGAPSCSVIELHGLESLRRIPGHRFTVSADDLHTAEGLRQRQFADRMTPKTYTIRRLDTVTIDGSLGEWPDDSIDGFRLGYDARMLYLAFNGKDDKAVFQNAATQGTLHEAFIHGDVVDLMLQTDSAADADRSDAVAGDLRLSIAMIDNKPQAILYRPVVPGSDPAQAQSFASPWRSVTIDEVRLVDSVQIAVTRDKDRYSLEAAIPLAELGLQPRSGLQTRGDVGRVLSDQTGSTRIDRVYWSNTTTRTVADLPTEARLQPSLWGHFTFE